MMVAQGAASSARMRPNSALQFGQACICLRKLVKSRVLPQLGQLPIRPRRTARPRGTSVCIVGVRGIAKIPLSTPASIHYKHTICLYMEIWVRTMPKPSHATSWMPRLGRNSGPLYLAIADAVAADIAGGALQPGMRLPPQRALADALGIDFTTETRAYAEA